MAENAASSGLFAVFLLSIYSLFLIPYTIYRLCAGADEVTTQPVVKVSVPCYCCVLVSVWELYCTAATSYHTLTITPCIFLYVCRARNSQHLLTGSRGYAPNVSQRSSGGWQQHRHNPHAACVPPAQWGSALEDTQHTAISTTTTASCRAQGSSIASGLPWAFHHACMCGRPARGVPLPPSSRLAWHTHVTAPLLTPHTTLPCPCRPVPCRVLCLLLVALPPTAPLSTTHYTHTTENILLLGMWVFWCAMVYYSQSSIADMKPFDPFEILGVPRDATDRDIAKAYRKLSLLYHPDKVRGVGRGGGGEGSGGKGNAGWGAGEPLNLQLEACRAACTHQPAACAHPLQPAASSLKRQTQP